MRPSNWVHPLVAKKTGVDFVFGRHAVAALLDRDPAGIRELWLQDNRRDGVSRRARELARAHGISLNSVPRATMDRLLAGESHQGIAARYRATRTPSAPDLASLVDGLHADPLLLVLDGIQDPHNLGACMRSADAAGVAAVIVPKRRAATLTPTVRKVASGACERLPLVAVGNLAQALGHLQEAGVRVIGAAARSGVAYTDADWRGAVAVVLGGEAKGLRRLTREICDEMVHIPMSGAVGSLNVSVAAALCLFEARRQRGGTGDPR